MITTITYVILGLFSGMVSGMTGASGVMVLIPVLTVAFGFPLYVAIGTSLLADVISSIPIAATYYKNGNLAWKAAIWLIIGSVLGAQVGVEGTQLFPESWIMIVFALGVAGVGLKMWREGIKKEMGVFSWKMPWWLELWWARILLGLGLGFFLGLITGLFGAGGGIFYFLVLYFLLRLPLKVSIGTAAFAMIASSISGAFGHWSVGNLDLQTGLIIGFSAAAGGIIAATLANRIPDGLLSKTVGVVFIVLAVVMLAVRIL